jgi:hypothetical protein
MPNHLRDTASSWVSIDLGKESLRGSTHPSLDLSALQALCDDHLVVPWHHVNGLIGPFYLAPLGVGVAVLDVQDDSLDRSFTRQGQGLAIVASLDGQPDFRELNVLPRLRPVCCRGSMSISARARGRQLCFSLTVSSEYRSILINQPRAYDDNLGQLRSQRSGRLSRDGALEELCGCVGRKDDLGRIGIDDLALVQVERHDLERRLFLLDRRVVPPDLELRYGQVSFA